MPTIIINFEEAIANNYHRVRLKKLQLDLDFFNNPNNIIKDSVYSQECVTVFNQLANENEIIIFTQRDVSLKNMTFQWMIDNGLQIDNLKCFFNHDFSKEPNLFESELEIKQPIVVIDNNVKNDKLYSSFNIPVVRATIWDYLSNTEVNFENIMNYYEIEKSKVKERRK